MKILARLAAVTFGIAFALLALEAACKWIEWQQASARNRVTHRISRVSEIPGVRFELVPNVEAATPGQSQVIRINNHGLRGRDVTIEKPPGTFRIVVLGDSVALGRTIPEEATFSGAVEIALRKARPEASAEVLNASLSGRDTWEEAAVLRHRMLAFSPDLVVLQICLNDHVRLPQPAKNAPIGVFGDQDWWSYSSLLAMLDRRFPSFRRAHVATIDRLGFRRSRERVILDNFIDPGQMLNVEAHWDDWTKALLEIRDLSRSAGAEIVFLLFPIRQQAERKKAVTLPRLAAFLESESVPLVDLAPRFRGRPHLFYDDTHPTADGHALAAVELERWIRRRFAGVFGEAGARQKTSAAASDIRS